MSTSRRAPVYEIADPLGAIEECYRRGWTDGLPVVPPTEERVSAMLDYMGLAPGQILGEVPVRRRILTAEQAAAVLALLSMVGSDSESGNESGPYNAKGIVENPLGPVGLSPMVGI